MNEVNPELGEQFKKVIQNQIKLNKPPITKETYNRLISEGFDEKETIRLMACVLTQEMSNMFNTNKTFDEKEYEIMMRKLPKLPWD
jgi:hypothetical protein